MRVGLGTILMGKGEKITRKQQFTSLTLRLSSSKISGIMTLVVAMSF